MSQTKNSIQPMQIVVLLLIVGGVGLAVSWGLRNLINEPTLSPLEERIGL